MCVCVCARARRPVWVLYFLENIFLKFFPPCLFLLAMSALKMALVHMYQSVLEQREVRKRSVCHSSLPFFAKIDVKGLLRFSSEVVTVFLSLLMIWCCIRASSGERWYLCLFSL